MNLDRSAQHENAPLNRVELRVSLLPEMEPVAPAVDVAIVIDVLRATSVIPTALANGAVQVMTCESIDQARTLRDQWDDVKTIPLLCGERMCQPIPGFDLGNSPAEYSPESVGGRNLIVTTTNGTRAIQSAREAREIWLASFLNLEAVLNRLSGRLSGETGASIKNVHLVCAGTERAITLEDVFLAGCVVDQLGSNATFQVVGDQARLARHAFRSILGTNVDLTSESLSQALRDTQGGRNLIQRGYEPDLSRCAQLNLHDVVPVRVVSTGAVATPDVVTFQLD